MTQQQQEVLEQLVTFLMRYDLPIAPWGEDKEESAERLAAYLIQCGVTIQ